MAVHWLRFNSSVVPREGGGSGGNGSGGARGPSPASVLRLAQLLSHPVPLPWVWLTLCLSFIPCASCLLRVWSFVLSWGLRDCCTGLLAFSKQGRSESCLTLRQRVTHCPKAQAAAGASCGAIYPGLLESPGTHAQILQGLCAGPCGACLAGWCSLADPRSSQVQVSLAVLLGESQGSSIQTWGRNKM